MEDKLNVTTWFIIKTMQWLHEIALFNTDWDLPNMNEKY